jgi:hypothetical protein
MSALPLHIQRRLEQRWAARFGAPATGAVPKSNRLKDALNTLPCPEKTKEKPAESGKRAE